MLPIRRELLGVLSLVCLLSVIAIWTDGAPEPVVPPVIRERQGPLIPERSVAQVAASPTSRALVAEDTSVPLERPPIALAKQDPFVSPHREPLGQRSAQSIAAAIAPRPSPTLEARPQANLPAPPSYRFLGRIRSPDGQLHTYLATGERPLVVAPGVRLDSGHVVEAVSESEVHLRHLASEQSSVIRISPPRSWR